MTDTDNMIPPSDGRKPDINPDDRSPFTWDHPAVVVQAVAATAVYVDEHGNVVIRQQAAWDEESDHLIILPRREAEKVAAAIFDATVALWPSNRNRQREAETEPKTPPSARRDLTAAARQRRRRERMRDGARDSRDAGRDSQRDTATDEKSLHREAAE